VELVRGFVRLEPLQPVVRLRTERRPVQLGDGAGGALGELTDDRVAVLDGGRTVQRFRQLEVELAPGAPDDVLDPVVARLRKAGARRAGAPASKYLQALAALGDHQPGPPELDPGAPGRDATVPQLLAADLAASVRRLILHDPLVRLGEDPEAVHQARVATRRLRSSLRTFAAVLAPEWATALRDQVGWLAEQLGAVRDAEVLLARLKSRLGGLPDGDRAAARQLLGGLVERRQAARAQLLASMAGDRYLGLLDTLVAAAQDPAVPDPDRSATAVLPAAVARSWRKLARAVAAAGEHPTDGDLHRIRIRAKRCRYAAEAVVPLGGKPARRLAKACAELQDVLGDHHDAVVAEAWLREAAGRTRRGALALVAGELVAAERAAAGADRGRWREVWRALDRKSLRSWW
jgi:CHAD domain-containing protein